MTNQDFSYGVIGYNSMNIGDEIQSVAASRFVPRIDEYPQREIIKDFVPKSGKKTKLIMNAWWMFNTNEFPPNEKYIDPLLISMYLNIHVRNDFLKKEKKDFLKKFGPVGCRDVGTCEWLNANDIPAYFSGCLTLTLQRNYDIPRQDYILCIDVPQNIVDEIKKLTKRPVYALTRKLSPMYTPTERMDLAKIMLRLYHDAHLVVSPRFHAIVPSLAMETPVLRLVATDPRVVSDKTRYTGYESFFNSIDIEKESFLDELRNFDFENPPKNPENHIQMRNDLIKRCSEFTGYDNTHSLIENEPYPLIKLIQLNSHTEYHLKRILYCAKEKDLIETLINKSYGVKKYCLVGEIPKDYESKPKLPIILKYLRYSILSIIIPFGKKHWHYKFKSSKLRLVLDFMSLIKHM